MTPGSWTAESRRPELSTAGDPGSTEVAAAVVAAAVDSAAAVVAAASAVVVSTAAAVDASVEDWMTSAAVDGGATSATEVVDTASAAVQIALAHHPPFGDDVSLTGTGGCQRV